MRNALCQTLVAMAADPKFVFLTGDLGFGALEPLRDALGDRFINCGVAEQNMVSVAAGLAKDGMKPWVYSIAPFLYARAFEQIRNDVCLHNLPVKFIGNGGGYGYGVMGSSHHALEDYGTLLCLPNMRVFVPAFASDIAPIVAEMDKAEGPTYLRLGRCEKPTNFDTGPYAPWRQLLGGDGSVVIVCGPLAGSYIEPMAAVSENKCPSLWVVSELPLKNAGVPFALLFQARERALIIAEEHVQNGGAGGQMAQWIMADGKRGMPFLHRYAFGYPSGSYGSQAFHRKESGLDAASIVDIMECLCQR